MQKHSLTIEEMAKVITENEKRNQDFIVPTKQIMVRPDAVEVHGVGEFTPTEHFHRQVSSFTDIPYKYYDRMMAKPDLFNHSLATWLGEKSSNRMLRTQAPAEATLLAEPAAPTIARAFLSDRYRRIDNFAVANAILPVLMNTPGTVPISSQVTEKKMYIMVAFANREAEVKKGDVIQAGLIITNSEIGVSRFGVQPYIHRLWCLNGAVLDDAGKYGFTQVHVGKQVTNEGSQNYIAYQDETLQADDKALQLKMRDVVQSLATGPMWDDIVNGLQQAASSEPIADPVEAVKVLGKACTLSEGEQKNVLTNLIQGGDLTKWGAGNAITSVANTIDDYDRATELQQLGGKLFTMPAKQWQEIAQAA